MPEYSFFCTKCKHKFVLICGISSYSATQTCDKCKTSSKVIRLYKEDLASLNTAVKKSDGELKTLGDLANRNRDKMSDDKKASLAQKHNDYKESTDSKDLPKGMTRLKKQPKTKWM